MQDGGSGRDADSTPVAGEPTARRLVARRPGVVAMPIRRTAFRRAAEEWYLVPPGTRYQHLDEH